MNRLKNPVIETKSTVNTKVIPIISNTSTTTITKKSFKELEIYKSRLSLDKELQLYKTTPQNSNDYQCIEYSIPVQWKFKVNGENTLSLLQSKGLNRFTQSL